MPLWSARCVTGDTPSDNPKHGAEDRECMRFIDVSETGAWPIYGRGMLAAGGLVRSGKEERGNSGRDFDTLTASTDCDIVHLEQNVDGLRWESWSGGGGSRKKRAGQ